jgi:hypothetical protein
MLDQKRFHHGVDVIVVNSLSGPRFRLADEVEHLADDVSLQASDDVAFAETFGGAAGYVLDRGLVERIRT